MTGICSSNGTVLEHESILRVFSLSHRPYALINVGIIDGRGCIQSSINIQFARENRI